MTRTTREFTEDTVPRGLLGSHQVAEAVWGRIVVRGGSLDFAFEDDLDRKRSLVTGDTQAIPPARLHRVILTGPVQFVVEFYRVD